MKVAICACLFMLLFYSSLNAGDGQIDILPNGKETLTISQPGSYILTDNVTMSADVSCISITSNDVTLDLNGHIITGTDSGSAKGIDSYSTNDIRIKNGTVTKFGGTGINMGDKSLVEDIKVSLNGGKGISVGNYSSLIRVVAESNHLDGIAAKSSAMIKDCSAFKNVDSSTGYGIDAGDGSIITKCISRENGPETGTSAYEVCGIKVGNGCSVTGCTVCNNRNHPGSPNSLSGIRTGNYCTIQGNTCSSNNSTASGITVYGIRAGTNCIIKENTCSGNIASGENGISIGILANEQCELIENICSQNKAGGTGGMGYGIYSDSKGNLIKGNNCSENVGKATAIGIFLDWGDSRVDGNLCSGHLGIYGEGYGIVSDNSMSNAIIVNNHLMGNKTAGIDLANGFHYCGDNIIGDSPSVINTTNSTMGTGDHANIIF